MTTAFSLALASVIALALNVTPVFAAQPSNPVMDPNFVILPNGKDLRTLSTSNGKLVLKKGDGKTFTAALQAKYLKIKNDSLTKKNTPVTWVLMDLDAHQIVAQSAEASRKQFGASVNKIFIAATLLDKTRGQLNSNQLHLMVKMLADSSNVARDEMAWNEIGGGNKTRGRQAIQNFTQRMGYLRTRAYGGYLGSLHGNELSATETAEFLYDTYQGRYPGAEYVWKLMHTCRTGAGRARTYLPTSLIVGGKTGTYSGGTVDPETGRSTSVRVKHHTIIFNYDGREYALSIYANTGLDETTAILAGGLVREYIIR
ncbi:MAG: serine hydrolase [Bacteriovoracia bacterium]